MNMNDLKSGEPFFDDWYIDSYIGTTQSCSAFKIYREQDGLREYNIMKVIEIPRDKYDGCVPFELTEDKTEAQDYKELVTDIYRKVCLLESLPDRQHIVSCEEHLINEVSDPPGYEILIRTEFLESFRDSFDWRSMTYQDVVLLGRNICEALDLCERYHIIHGDIQPDCIYLSEHGQYKLGDFSLIQTKEQEEDDSNSIPLSLFDYSGYTAPEILSEKRYDNRSDIYSLGLVLYTCLNHNELPLNEKNIPLPCNGPKELGRVILKACEFFPEDRYQSAKEFQEALIAISVFLGDVLTEPINSNELEEPEIYVAATQEDRSECAERSKEPVQGNKKALKDRASKEINGPIVSLTSKKRAKNMGPWILAIWTSVLTIVVLILLIKNDFIMNQQDTVETGLPTAIAPPTNVLSQSIMDQTFEGDDANVTDFIDETRPTNEPGFDEGKLDSVTDIPEESITLIHSGEELDSLEQIESLDEAKVMDFSNNAISNLSALSSSSKVETLKLNKNVIKDIRALKQLVTLKELDLSDNEIVTVVSLKGLTNLEVLSLSNNKLPNILGIERLSKLKMLYLDGNDIKDVSKLTSLKELVFLDLSNNRLTEKQVLELQNALPNCIINY